MPAVCKAADLNYPLCCCVLSGTLLVPRERTADVYLRYGSKYGVTLSEAEVLERFRW